MLEVFVEKENLPKPIMVDALFGTKGDLVIEIGFGKGHFMRQYAKAEPQTHFLGIERFIKWTRHAQVRLEQDELSNVKLVCGLAQEVIADYIEDASVREIHILFPDPWPKRKHHKHRILQKKHIELFYKKLIPGGQLHITTDHKDYFEYAMKEIAPFIDKHFSMIPKTDSPYKTNFQIKYEKEGRPIYYFQANKI